MGASVVERTRAAGVFLSADGIALSGAKQVTNGSLACMKDRSDNMNVMDQMPTLFSERGYLVLRRLIQNPILSDLYGYSCWRADSGKTNIEDDQVPGTPSVGGDPIMEKLLVRLLPKVEETTGLKVFPTYSYFRVYKKGDILAKHKDRPSCEISITLCLGYGQNDSWPIWIEGPHGQVAVDLAPGDGMMYRGVELTHWRDRFTGERASQVFLHYVDQNGPYADWKFDKRASFIGDR